DSEETTVYWVTPGGDLNRSRACQDVDCVLNILLVVRHRITRRTKKRKDASSQCKAHTVHLMQVLDAGLDRRPRTTISLGARWPGSKQPCGKAVHGKSPWAFPIRRARTSG